MDTHERDPVPDVWQENGTLRLADMLATFLLDVVHSVRKRIGARLERRR
jgi:hypothetical protein